MTDIRAQLHQIAYRFVSAVFAATKTASIGQLVEGGALPRTNGRRRASPEEVQRQKDVALTAAKALEPGFRRGDVMRKTGSRVDLSRALSLLVADGKLTKKGDRRATRYWVR